MPNLTLRGCCIGTGRPKVIIPIVERTESAILEKAAAFSTLKADCVEWRADWFDAVSDAECSGACACHGLRTALGEKLLLVTFRTQAEGGETAVGPRRIRGILHDGLCLLAVPTCWTLSFSPTERHCPPSLRRPTPPG